MLHYSHYPYTYPLWWMTWHSQRIEDPLHGKWTQFAGRLIKYFTVNNTLSHARVPQTITDPQSATMARQIRFFILLVLATAFGVQVYQNVSKFLSRRTTVVSRLESRRSEGVDFPSVSVCPGFKSNIRFWSLLPTTDRCGHIPGYVILSYFLTCFLTSWSKFSNSVFAS